VLLARCFLFQIKPTASTATATSAPEAAMIGAVLLLLDVMVVVVSALLRESGGELGDDVDVDTLVATRPKAISSPDSLSSSSDGALAGSMKFLASLEGEDDGAGDGCGVEGAGDGCEE